MGYMYTVHHEASCTMYNFNFILQQKYILLQYKIEVLYIIWLLLISSSSFLQFGGCFSRPLCIHRAPVDPYLVGEEENS